MTKKNLNYLLSPHWIFLICIQFLYLAPIDHLTSTLLYSGVIKNNFTSPIILWKSSSSNSSLLIFMSVSMSIFDYCAYWKILLCEDNPWLFTYGTTGIIITSFFDYFLCISSSYLMFLCKKWHCFELLSYTPEGKLPLVLLYNFYVTLWQDISGQFEVLY